MKKNIILISAVVILVGGWYLLTHSTQKDGSDPRNTSYIIDGTSYTLQDGVSEEILDGTTITTTYFGNELRVDLNDDGREDSVFLITQDTGGTGTFFYVAAALNTQDGWQGSHALFLGDRIAPQTIEVSRNPSHHAVVVVNYADRGPTEPMSAQPSVGKSVWLKLDPTTLQFGEVVQDFEGDANPSDMTLDMKTWSWLKTQYNNDTEVVPTHTDTFTITFNKNGTFSATTDCNTMSGTYSTTNTQLTFGDAIAMTRMFCEGSQEMEFSKMLQEVQSFLFTTRGELVLELALDSGSVIFR